MYTLQTNTGSVQFDPRRRLALILLLALAFRAALLIAVWHHDENVLTNDSPTYLHPAMSILHEGAFRYNGQPEVLRTPGYPVFLLLAGVRSPSSFGSAQIVQVLLSVAWVYLTYRLAVMLVGPAAALWAALLHSVSSGPIAFSVLIITEGLFAFLLTAALVLLVRHFQHDGWASLMRAAAVTAAAVYTRPIGFIFAPAVALILLFRPRRLARTAVFVGLFTALVAPWYVRNYFVAGYKGFSSIGDFNLLYYEAAPVVAKVQGISTDSAREQVARDFQQGLERRGISSDSSAPAMKVAREMGRDLILAHPDVR